MARLKVPEAAEAEPKPFEALAASPTLTKALAGVGFVAALVALQVLVAKGGLANRGVALGVLLGMAFYVYALAAALTRGGLEHWGLDQAALLHVLPWLMAAGVIESASVRNLDPSTTLIYGALNGLLAWVLVGPRLHRAWSASAAPLPVGEADGWRLWAWAFGCTAALSALILWSHHWANTSLRTGAPSDAIFLYFVDRRAGLDFTPGGPYLGFFQTLPALVFLVAAAGAVTLFVRRFGPDPRVLLPVLIGTALLGKLQVGNLSVGGLYAILPQKIGSIHTAYYNLVPLVDKLGAREFIAGFNGLQARLATHGETHPFGPEIFYWGLAHLAGFRPTVVALIIMLLTAFTLAPLWVLAQSAFQSRWAGFAAAALWASSPMSLIMSTSGIDSMVAFTLVSFLAVLDQSVRRRSWAWAAGAGAVFFAASLLSSGSFLFLLYALLWVGLVPALQGSKGPGEWLSRLVPALVGFAAVFVLLHLALAAATGFRFSYAQVMQAALPAQRDLTQVRPYQVWMPLNPLLFLGYAGVGLGGLLLARGLKFMHKPQRDAPLVLGAVFLLTLMLTSLGNAEAQRIFQYALLMLLLAGLPLLLKRDPQTGGVGLQGALLAAVVALNFLNAVFLGARVANYW